MPSPHSQANSVDSSLPTHSLCFDELAVILPENINQPTLQQLASRLQAKLLVQVASTTIEQGNPPIACSDEPLAQHLLNSLKNTPVANASVLVAITHETKPKLLLTRRAGHLHAHAGEVSFAGGKYEPADGNNVVTALREACEETALPPNCVKMIGQLPVQTSKSGMSVRPIVVLIPSTATLKPVLVPELGEIEHIFWADFEALIQQPVQDYEVPYVMNGTSTTLLTPSWRVNDEVVWGLTGRVIASLFDIGFDRKIDWYYQVKPE